MLDQVVVRDALVQLRGLLAAAEAGDVEATAQEVAHLRGAIDALEHVLAD